MLSTHPYDSNIEASTYELNPEFVSLKHNGTNLNTSSLILYKKLFSITGILKNSLELPMEIEIHIRKALV